MTDQRIILFKKWRSPKAMEPINIKRMQIIVHHFVPVIVVHHLLSSKIFQFNSIVFHSYRDVFIQNILLNSSPVILAPSGNLRS
ncbi:MAG TPA: hypothetical protein DCL77_13545 [Prolixibacteraceae bacterium]|nr:hypothetical protein [Prolixibacteraceae bacterium]